LIGPGWFHAFVELTRDGQPLACRGASMKRGAPAAADCLTLATRRTRCFATASNSS
jgi:hypothetical protein